MLNYYYKDSIAVFQQKSIEKIIGEIILSNQFDSTINQNKSWEQQILILKTALEGLKGTIFFEFSIPRMGKRVDCLVIIENVVFVIEFKIGEKDYLYSNVDQVWDYALDLKNFHKPSHDALLVPILIASEARTSFIEIITTSHNDKLVIPIKSNKSDLRFVILNSLLFFSDKSTIEGDDFAKGELFTNANDS